MAAILIRNQCAQIVRYHLSSSHDPYQNGEALVAQTIAAPDCTFFDVGANVGLWTRMFLALEPEASGVLIEPSPTTVRELQRRHGRHPNLKIREAAAGQGPGRVIFFENVENQEHSSIVVTPSSGCTMRYQIEMTTVDIEFALLSWECIDFLKIDTEGYDFEVLKGAESTIATQRARFIQFEYNSMWVNAGATLAASLSFLHSHGYSTFLIRSEGLFELDYRRYGEYFGYSNFLAVRTKDLVAVEPLLRGHI